MFAWKKEYREEQKKRRTIEVGKPRRRVAAAVAGKAAGATGRGCDREAVFQLGLRESHHLH